jgi:hypothetical protein
MELMLYKRFGISDEGVDPGLQEKHAHRAEQRIQEGAADVDHHVSILLSSNTAIATRYYLLDNHEKATQYAERTLLSAEQYFLGDWRTKVKTDEGTIDPEWWHDVESWMLYFRGTLCWGSVLGEWDRLRKLASYPDERRGIDTIDVTPAFRLYLIEVARYLRGEKVQGVAKACAKLEGTNWRGIDCLAAALDAVIDRDERRAQSSVVEFFLKHHKRKKSKDIYDTVSLDGTTMVNIAKRAKLNVKVPPEHAHYYIELTK